MGINDVSLRVSCARVYVCVCACVRVNAYACARARARVACRSVSCADRESTHVLTGKALTHLAVVELLGVLNAQEAKHPVSRNAPGHMRQTHAHGAC